MKLLLELFEGGCGPVRRYFSTYTTSSVFIRFLRREESIDYEAVDNVVYVEDI